MRRDGTLIYLPTHKPCKRSPRQLDGFSKSTVVLDLDAYAACPTSSKVEALWAIPIQTSTTLTQQHQLKAIRRQQEFQIKRAEKARAEAELTMLNAESTDKRQLELRLGIMREEVALVGRQTELTRLQAGVSGGSSAVRRVLRWSSAIHFLLSCCLLHNWNI